MKEQDRRFTLDELSALVEMPKRTLRYYIQIGLVDRPEGLGRGAHYGERHLDQLLEVRKWVNAGVSLERIRELLTSDGDTEVPPRPRRGGSIEVWSHIVVDDGIELTVEPRRAGLSPEQVKALAQGVMALYSKIKDQGE